MRKKVCEREVRKREAGRHPNNKFDNPACSVGKSTVMSALCAQTSPSEKVKTFEYESRDERD